MDSSERALQTNEMLFFKFRIRFRNYAGNRKMFKLIEKREY